MKNAADFNGADVAPTSRISGSSEGAGVWSTYGVTDASSFPCGADIAGSSWSRVKWEFLRGDCYLARVCCSTGSLRSSNHQLPNVRSSVQVYLPNLRPNNYTVLCSILRPKIVSRSAVSTSTEGEQGFLAACSQGWKLDLTDMLEL